MQILYLIGFYLVTIGGYFYFTHLPELKNLRTTWDKYIPVVPVMIVPYLFNTLLFLALPIFFYLNLGWSKTKPYLLTMFTANLISFAIFGLYPTSVVREPISGNDIFSNTLKFLYVSDRPSAAFPSGHVFEAIIIGYFLWQYFPVTRIYVLILVPIIIASTVLLKQHYLPDILGGIITAVIAIALINFLKIKARI
ncbi:MAG: phosphatase PAP2 family protein [Patescibacteria group bacterium]|nr:phosphatase PAP2 family protein [Patescibacteria group bacterium]